ncbi:LysR family transcriptional regulator [Legionella nagasakiensis]|uniref:LysR family transcriptional regulator n=1 Tax=Legionella nagasakiensis TaxID=535290 RepID=UPI001054D660|nr:LysR family transcriptional regulator [Legionella nagasakiensis]
MANLSQIEIFLEVVKHRSFIEAARALGMSGPAMSKQVQSLERTLGVRLLNRTTRLINLTEEGAIYSEKVEKAINDIHEAEQEILESKLCPTGPLRVSVPVSFGHQYLIEPINRFIQDYPNVALEVLFDDRRIDLMAENVDVAIRIGALDDSNLIARKLHHCPIVLCVSPQLLQQHEPLVHPKDLMNFPAIIYNKHGHEDYWRYISADGEKGSVKLNKRIATNTAEMMVQACLSGIGIAAIPIFACVNHLESGELVEVLQGFKTHPQFDIYIIYKYKQHMSTRLRIFIDKMVEFVKKLSW